MKFLSVAFLLLIFLAFAGCNRDRGNLVNPVIGDISFVETFGFQPDEITDNDLRIKTHLQYVERLLRKKDVSFLTQESKDKRAQLLDLLHSYSSAGNFPKNYDYSDRRKPCFIDKDKTICAVGYLIEKTAGREVAEMINATHKYDEIFEMKDEKVDEWIASSGLTKEECAMIQPTYGPYVPQPSLPVPPVRSRIKPGYAAASGITMGANLLFNISNEVDLARGRGNKLVPYLGLAGGAGQITLGIFGLNMKDNPAAGQDYTNSNQRLLSIANIGFGAATVLLSFRNLERQKKMAKMRNSWNVFSFPDGKKQAGIGLSFSKKI